MKRTLAVIAASAIATLAAAATAHADGPVIQVQTASATNVPWGPRCGAEPIFASFTVTRRIQSWFEGTQLVLQKRHVSGDGTITLPSTGVTLPYEVDFTVTTDPIAATSTVTGQQAHVLVPGSGLVFQNSGRLVQDVSTFPPSIIDEAGPHDYFDPGGTAQVCAALGV